MKKQTVEIKVRGKKMKFSSICINNSIVLSRGILLRKAEICEDEWLESQIFDNHHTFISELKRSNLRVDIFKFMQKLPNTEKNFSYYMETDNLAAIPITSYKEWWEKRLPQVTRKSIRRGEKRGVEAKVVEFNDNLVQGIVEIQNDTPIRQGIPFAHYGKEFDIVKQEYGTYTDRSEFIAAFWDDEIIGILKLVYIGEIASIMQIIAKTKHYDKRPTNILIAKAVEVCEKKGKTFLVFGRFVYGNKVNNSLTEFKRRNGFELINIPTYYIPLTLKGRIAIKLKLHRGVLGILPNNVIRFLREIRSRYYEFKLFFFKRLYSK